MIGFVSALSSAVAIVILLMSVLLTNLLSVTLSQDKKKNSANLIYHSNDKKSELLSDVKGVKGLSLSATDLLPLRRAKEKSAIRLYCTYGNNISLSIAKKYTAYNYIVANKTLSHTIVIEQPVYDPKGKNNCIAEEVLK